MDSKAFTLNAQTRSGRNFKRVSYLLPYMNISGTGMHFVPEEGAEVLIVTNDEGIQVCVGFRMPFSVNQNEREDVPQGSFNVAVIGEDGSVGRIKLLKGGTLLVQAKKSCRTLYSPADSSIIHLFSSWEMEGPAGFVRWKREIGKSRATYEAEYRTKTNKDDPGFRLRIRMNEDQPLSVCVDRGDSDQAPPIDLRVMGDGLVDVRLGSLKLRVLGELDVVASDFKINKRAVLPQGDAI